MKIRKFFVFSIFLVLAACEVEVPMCVNNDTLNVKNAQIYCGGPILQAVNYHALYNDSKSFVDSPLRLTPNDTLLNWFQVFGDAPPEKIDKDKLKEFVHEHFLEPGHELDECIPVGWIHTPKKLQTIIDPDLREWAMKLNAIWKKLCKKMKPIVAEKSEFYSLLPVKYEFIAPGGRFLEPYYWDAYWIIKGLMASEMYEAAARMILNYADFVERFGFIPNGGRVYYLQRSQPPLFIPMIYEFFENTQNVSFVKQLLPIMEKEFQYWIDYHSYTVTFNGNRYQVFRYFAGSNVPRPESYKEDLATAALSNVSDKQQLYRDIASAAESGQDFSTRWFANSLNITTIETTTILPVDLNSYLCWNMAILDYLFYEVADDADKSKKYHDMLVQHRHNVQAVFYNSTSKAWFDFNTRTGKHNPIFYASLAAPLFTNCYNILDQNKAEGLFEFFKNEGAFSYPSGIPESMKRDSGEQWDFPNGWGNINHMVIEGLRKSESPAMQDQAFEIAKKWIRGNYRVYAKTGHMWEKYNVSGSIPSPGSGGEYNVQDGFGWTNGAVLDLLVTYADRITAQDPQLGNNSTTTIPSTTPSTSTLTTSTATVESSHLIFAFLCARTIFAFFC